MEVIVGLGAVVAGLQGLALTGCAYALAVALLPDQAGSRRLAATATIAIALAAAWFLIAGSLGVLSVGATSAVFIGGGLWALTRREQLAQPLADDATLMREAWQELRRSRTCWVLVLPAAVGLLRLGRALAHPPLATDALTYHLLRAGHWVQAGGLAHEPAPDMWGYADFYPPVGDGLWALAMLPVHGDALLGPASFAVWLAGPLGAYACARGLGAERDLAALTGGTIACLPAVLVFATSGYVDALLLAMILLACAHLALARGHGVGLAIVAVSVAAGVKHTGLAAFTVVGLLALVIAIRHGRLRQLVIASVGGATLLALAYAHPALETGNPLYPFSVPALGWTGNEESALLHGGRLAPAELTQFSATKLAGWLFWPTWKLGVQHLNFGPVTPALLVLGLLGAFRGVGRPEHRPVIAGLLGLGLLFGIGLAFDGMLAFRTFMAPAAGRLIAPGVAAIVLLAALAPRKLAVPTVAGGIVFGSVLSFPQGLAPSNLGAVLGALGLLALPVAATGWLVGRGRARAAALTLLVGVGIAGAAVGNLRESSRYPVWSGAVDARSFDPHPTDARASAVWPIWEKLDAPDGSTVAFVAGWDGMGHHWYRYPLLGSALQNEVVYVPPTRDGTIIDYRDRERLAPALDPRAWLQRIEEREIEWLVIAAPRPVEAAWVEQLPDVFEPVTKGGEAVLYEVHHDRIDTALDRNTRP